MGLAVKLLISILSIWLTEVHAAPLSTTTIELRQRLHHLSDEEPTSKTFFGAQRTFIEGRGWLASDLNLPANQLPDSDLYRVIGKNPALAGYDFDEINEKNLKMIQNQMREIHRRHGIVTLSWHMKNPLHSQTGNTAKTKISGTVTKILTDPQSTQKYLKLLDRLAIFLNEMKDIPIIFRPFHEHNRNWFWWGQEHCTKNEFIRLWKKTVHHLKAKGVNNILLAYSPINVGSDYLERYPGKDYVDIFGVDMYFQNTPKAFSNRAHRLNEWKQEAIQLLTLAKKHGKIPAITEIGNESLLYPNFWTHYFAWPLQKEGVRQYCKKNNCKSPEMNFAYTMLWRNDSQSSTHFYAPYPGSNQNDNFLQLVKKNFLLFMED